MSIVGILFAVIGLSFLIFIHELGHYLMAKKAGMKIEVFSIGMGKPIVSWKQNGVKWQICYLLFGGYVRIAGMEGENGKEPYQVRGGFYSKKPAYRLLVAAAGPFVNIVFALLLFFVVYMAGGQMKPFAAHTKIIGSVDKGSQVDELAISAGDKIISIDGVPYRSFKDAFMPGMLKQKQSVDVVFEKKNKEIVKETIHLYTPTKGSVPKTLPEEWRTMGVLSSANYLVADGFTKEGKAFAPLKDSGIEKGDRIVYVDGEIIYSYPQLEALMKKDIALITVKRDGNILNMQVPRVALGDLKLSQAQQDEFLDTKREINLAGALSSLQFIPYLVSNALQIEEPLLYLEEMPKKDHFTLQKGDEIIAVSGKKVSSAKEFYEAISQRNCVVMLAKETTQTPLWLDADNSFNQVLAAEKIKAQENTFGTDKEGAYKVITASPVTYKQYLENAHPEEIAILQERMDKEDFNQLMGRDTLFSGLKLKDKEVVYNPTPLVQTGDVISEMAFSFKGLFSGSLSPRHLSGPVGMVKMVHDGSKGSITTGIYWLGLISLNLGLMNLLPLPILDGGHICFTFYEMITRKRIKAKTMQKMMVPFFFLLIAFFAYVTFYDVIKVFG